MHIKSIQYILYASLSKSPVMKNSKVVIDEDILG